MDLMPAPLGGSQLSSNLFRNIDITHNRISWNRARIGLASTRIATKKPLDTSFIVTYSIHEGTTRRQITTIGTVDTTNPFLGSLISDVLNTGLTSGKRHILAIRADGLPHSRLCFRTAYAGDDMNRKPENNDLGRDSLAATGCFALGGERLGGGPEAIRACFCGARNMNGKWARTDSGNGYVYMLDADERMRWGCTTN